MGICASSDVDMDKVNQAVARSTGQPAIRNIPREIERDERKVNNGIKKDGKYTYCGHEFTADSKREEILKAVSANVVAQAVGDELVDVVYDEIREDVEGAASNEASRRVIRTSTRAALKKGIQKAAHEAAEAAVTQMLKEEPPSGEPSGEVAPEGEFLESGEKPAQEQAE